MLNVKGFVTINSLVRNDKAQTAILGELSSISRTYSREIGEYTSRVYQGYELLTFSAVNVDSSEHAVLLDNDVDFCIGVIRSIHTYAANNIRPYDTTNFMIAVRGEHIATLNNLDFGDYVDNGQFALPEWVEFSNSITGSVFRIWLADSAFQQQYDLFAIEVVPFLQNIDDFFQPYGSVTAAIDGSSIKEFMEKIYVKRNKNPETILHILDFEFTNVNNSVQKKKVSWGVLIYGIAGDNIDSIKDAIVEFIRSNSQRPIEDWEVIFPDIFKRTEFCIYPRWDKVAIPNLTRMSEIYSSIVNYNELASFSTLAAKHYKSSHVLAHIEVLPHVHKSVSLVAVSGETNEVAVSKLADMYPDYIPLTTTALDYGRMTENTRKWSEFLFNLIKVAESMTRYSTIPANMRRLNKLDNLYISAVYNDVNYLVSAKSNEIYQ